MKPPMRQRCPPAPRVPAPSPGSGAGRRAVRGCEGEGGQGQRAPVGAVCLALPSPLGTRVPVGRRGPAAAPGGAGGSQRTRAPRPKVPTGFSHRAPSRSQTWLGLRARGQPLAGETGALPGGSPETLLHSLCGGDQGGCEVTQWARGRASDRSVRDVCTQGSEWPVSVRVSRGLCLRPPPPRPAGLRGGGRHRSLNGDPTPCLCGSPGPGPPAGAAGAAGAEPGALAAAGSGVDSHSLLSDRKGLFLRPSPRRHAWPQPWKHGNCCWC